MAGKKSSLGVLFWIALILLILVVFLFNKTRIETVLDSTGFLTVLQKKFHMEGKPEVHVSPISPETKARDSSPAPRGEKRLEPIAVAPEPRTGKPEPTTPETTLVKPAPAGTATSAGTTAPARTPSPSGNPGVAPGDVKSGPEPRTGGETSTSVAGKQEPKQIRQARLFFILVDDEGRINLKAVPRTVAFTDSPLSSTLHELLAGLSHDDIRSGLMSLIPENSRLISAWVKDGTAYLNFNESFRFNPLGMDGYIAQLKQIVYSATEFPTVKSVQFLIEGVRLDYLTAEGLYIGSPLGRDSF